MALDAFFLANCWRCSKDLTFSTSRIDSYIFRSFYILDMIEIIHRCRS